MRGTRLKSEGGALPRGIRNNNPGNLVITSQKWLGKVPLDKNTDGHFEQFIDPVYGIRAAILVLKSYHHSMKTDLATALPTSDGDGDGRLFSIHNIIRRWAPPNENNTAAYIDMVSRALNAPATAVLSFSRTSVELLLRAIFMMENGRQYKDYYDAAQWDEAFKLARVK